MHVTFLWFILYGAVWLAAMAGYVSDMAGEVWRLFGLSGFFAIFFLLPLFKKQWLVLLAYGLQATLATITLFPANGSGFNPFLLLVFGLQAAEMAYRLLTLPALFLPAIVQAAGLVLAASQSDLAVSEMFFAGLFMILLFAAAVVVHTVHHRGQAAQARYDALLTEYRGLKRRALSEEELARQEERALIGREIHDSVGHKLTALLMQLEAYRLKAGEQEQEQVEQLKKLAADSLEETRRAVKSYKQGEPGGLQGIMRLIRNLESNSFLRVNFSVQHGAFSFPLNGEQSFAVYRAVQEALTNMMKHAKAREASVRFEAPGGSVFRFEISNPISAKSAFKEGFGLQSMRERLIALDGDLDVFQTADAFVVRGWIPHVETGDRP